MRLKIVRLVILIAVLLAIIVVAVNASKEAPKSEVETLREENTQLKSALEQEQGDNTALEQRIDGARLECEKGSIAYNYLTPKLKQAVGSEPNCLSARDTQPQ